MNKFIYCELKTMGFFDFFFWFFINRPFFLQMVDHLLLVGSVLAGEMALPKRIPVVGGHGDGVLFFLGQHADELCGRARPDLAWGNHRARSQLGPCGDDGEGLDDAALAHLAADLHAAVGLQRAAVERGAVAHGDAVADLRLACDDGLVADGDERADDDGVGLGEDRGAVPDGRVLSDRDVAEHGGVGCYENTRRKVGDILTIVISCKLLKYMMFLKKLK